MFISFYDSSVFNCLQEISLRLYGRVKIMYPRATLFALRAGLFGKFLKCGHEIVAS